MSLLKATKNPDANCDMQKHLIHYAILPHEGSFQEAEVIRRAYEFNYFSANNVPILSGGSAEIPTDWITIDHPAVVVGAFKPAHDIQNALVVRLYESHGGSATAKLAAHINDILGEDVHELVLLPELPLVFL